MLQCRAAIIMPHLSTTYVDAVYCHRKASICFNVPRSTSGRRVLERNKVVSGGMKHQTKQSNREDTALRNIHFLIIELRET